MEGGLERRNLLRELEAARAERDAYLRQRDVALGERNEFLRQRDALLVERNQLRAELRPALEPDARRSPENSIFIATLPKSGTEFTWGGVRDATGLIAPVLESEFVSAYLSGYCNSADVVSTGVFTSERLILSGLRKLAPNGHVLASHCAATHHNVSVLRDAGFQKATVLIRDPRDATVSWTHHLHALGPGMSRFNSLIQALPFDYFAWNHEMQLAFQIRTFLPNAVNWIESWVEAAAGPDVSVEIQFVQFDQLRSDPHAMFEAIFKFHGIRNYDLSKIAPPQPGARHFRKGERGTWSDEFSANDRVFAQSLIGSRLDRQFDRIAI